jgi:hypothetical protein
MQAIKATRELHHIKPKHYSNFKYRCGQKDRWVPVDGAWLWGIFAAHALRKYFRDKMVCAVCAKPHRCSASFDRRQRPISVETYFSSGIFQTKYRHLKSRSSICPRCWTSLKRAIVIWEDKVTIEAICSRWLAAELTYRLEPYYDQI